MIEYPFPVGEVWFDEIEDHLPLLDKVLTTLSEAGLKIREDKCTFRRS